MTALLWLPFIFVLLALCVGALVFKSGEQCAACGCEDEVHRHDRTGTDCGRCGRESCPAFKARLVRRRKS